MAIVGVVSEDKDGVGGNEPEPGRAHRSRVGAGAGGCGLHAASGKKAVCVEKECRVRKPARSGRGIKKRGGTGRGGGRRGGKNRILIPRSRVAIPGDGAAVVRHGTNIS